MPARLACGPRSPHSAAGQVGCPLWVVGRGFGQGFADGCLAGSAVCWVLGRVRGRGGGAVRSGCAGEGFGAQVDSLRDL
jgi:hypothetical protein